MTWFLIKRMRVFHALLPIHRIKRKNIQGLKIYIAIGGFSLLADALLRGSTVVSDPHEEPILVF